MKTSIKVCLLYFLVVFSAGFVLGVFRVLFVVDAIGERNAELVELPVMATVCAIAARRLVLKNIAELTLARTILIGITALTLLLAFEFTVVLGLRGISINDYFASRDPVSGIAYLVSLAWYTAAPSFFMQDSQHNNDDAATESVY